MLDTANFYKNIKSVKDFNKLTNIKHFKRVPKDWYVIITDVKSSTKAIETGDKKTVIFSEILNNILQIIILRKSLLNFKKKISNNIDYQKFDDSLKMVISGNEQNSKELNEYLDNLYKENKVFYGIHKSDAALMTCLVFQKNGEQVHFVDSSNGGYALAAKQLKTQKKLQKSI